MMLYAYVDQNDCYWRQQFLIYNAVPPEYMSFIKNWIKVLKALYLENKRSINFFIKVKNLDFFSF